MLEAYHGTTYALELRSAIARLSERLPQQSWVDLQQLAADRINFRSSVEIDRSLSPEVSISTISGVPDRDGTIFLNKHSRLRLRCPNDRVQLWYRLLQSQLFEFQGHLVRLVQPQLTLPESSATLQSRLVTFKLQD